jgi:hypothetical protein
MSLGKNIKHPPRKAKIEVINPATAKISFIKPTWGLNT